MRVHQIRVDFAVTEQVKRYVFVYLIEAKSCYLIDSGYMVVKNRLHNI